MAEKRTGVITLKQRTTGKTVTINVSQDACEEAPCVPSYEYKFNGTLSSTSVSESGGRLCISGYESVRNETNCGEEQIPMTADFTSTGSWVTYSASDKCFVVSANTTQSSRTATVTLKQRSSNKTLQFTISQAGKEACVPNYSYEFNGRVNGKTLSPSNTVTLDLPNKAATLIIENLKSIRKDIKCGTGTETLTYSVSGSTNWAEFQGANSKNPKVLVTENTSTSPRSTTIILEQSKNGGENRIRLVINQDAKEACIPEYRYDFDMYIDGQHPNVSETVILEALQEGDTFPITDIVSNKVDTKCNTGAEEVPWSLEFNPSWVQLERLPNGDYNIKVSQNTTSSKREANNCALAQDESGNYIRFTVNQKANETPPEPDKKLFNIYIGNGSPESLSSLWLVKGDAPYEFEGVVHDNNFNRRYPVSRNLHNGNNLIEIPARGIYDAIQGQYYTALEGEDLALYVRKSSDGKWIYLQAGRFNLEDKNETVIDLHDM